MASIGHKSGTSDAEETGKNRGLSRPQIWERDSAWSFCRLVMSLIRRTALVSPNYDHKFGESTSVGHKSPYESHSAGDWYWECSDGSRHPSHRCYF